MSKKLLLKLFLVFLLSLTFVKGVDAAGITISPPKFEFEIEPGNAVVGEIKIVNDEDRELTLVTNVQDFIAGGETGNPQFINPEENDESISLGKWVQVLESEIIIEPRSKKTVQFTITVPENAEPGGHYGTIFFAPPAGGGQLSVVQRIGSLVLVRVKGEIKEAGALETYGSYTLAQNTNFKDAVEKKFYENTPVKFAIRYRNDGNVHLKPQGKIEIFNTFGKQLEQIGIKNVLNPQGVMIDQEIVNYLPVNDNLGNVLAKSTRMFTTEYNGTTFWYRHEDGSKEIKYKGFPVGCYTAKLALVGAGGEEVIKEIKFTIFPYKVILGYGLAGLLALFILVCFTRWRKKTLREKIRAELKKELQKKE